MYSFFQKRVDQGFFLVYNDDNVLLTHTKALMIELIEQLRQKSRLSNLKLVPKKSFHMFLRVDFLGQDFEN